ncbi:MAG: hypothetical protein D6719_07265 [Candidatus Dadabacteria bacterium]|nr:MAG: hypothetical protein D6719_07265 [Candidatus Dadabacteria bacterium]
MEKGNNPEKWNSLLAFLDERLQFGLLEHLRRVESYHFEDDTLFIKAGSKNDERYLRKEPVLQQLTVIACETTGVKSVAIEDLG